MSSIASMKSFFPQTIRDWDNRLDSLGFSVIVSDDNVSVCFFRPPVKSEIPLENICFGVLALNYLIRLWKICKVVFDSSVKRKQNVSRFGVGE